MSWPEPYEEVSLLLSKLQDQGLTEPEQSRLEELLRSDRTARRLYLQYIDLELELANTIVPPLDDPSVVVGPAFSNNGSTVPPTLRGRGSGSKWMGFFVAAALLLLVGIGMALWLFPDAATTHTPVVLAELEPTAGYTIVTDAKGQTREIHGHIDLHPGDTIEVGGKFGSAVLRYPDGTRITLTSPSTITCDDENGKLVQVREGQLALVVSPQPAGKPMRIRTPVAEVRVLGTEFVLVVRPEKSEVSVHEGKVQVTRVSDGNSVEVETGHRTIAAEDTDLFVEEISHVPDTWQEDFEKKPTRKWKHGEFIDVNLPEGSKGALRAVKSEAEGSVNYLITSPSEQLAGFASLNDDTCVRFTYQVTKDQPVTLILMTGKLEQPFGLAGFYRYDEIPTHDTKWRTITIPLSACKVGLVGDTKGAVPSPDEIITVIQFKADVPDPGLIVDEVAILRGAVQNVTIVEK